MGPKLQWCFLVVVAIVCPAQQCAVFPAGYAPFSTTSYVSDPDANGDRLVVGSMSMASYQQINNLASPAFPNQQYCGLVDLGGGISATAYVPSGAERSGDFNTFGGPLWDPNSVTGGPFPSGMASFPGNIIPTVRIPGTFAWRISTIGPPRIDARGVVNAANALEGITPGSWATVYGTNLARNTRSWSNSDFNGNNLPLSLDSVSVTIDGNPAPVYYINPRLINVQVPSDVASGSVPVQVTTPLGMTQVEMAAVQEFSPAFFIFTTQYPAAVHTDATYVGKTNLFGSTIATRPVKPGEYISIFGNSFGPTDPSVPSGQIFVGAAWLADPDALTIRVGDAPAEVQFAGLSGAGLYQLNVKMPDLPDGDQALVATIGGLSTQSGMYLTFGATPDTVLSSGNVTINGTYCFDFDSGNQGLCSDTSRDVYWEQETDVIRTMTPIHNAQIKNIGVTDFDSVTIDQLIGLSYSEDPIDGNDDATNELVVGDVFAVKTNSGNFAKVKIVQYGYNLRVQWVMYGSHANL